MLHVSQQHSLQGISFQLNYNNIGYSSHNWFLEEMQFLLPWFTCKIKCMAELLHLSPTYQTKSTVQGKHCPLTGLIVSHHIMYMLYCVHKHICHRICNNWWKFVKQILFKQSQTSSRASTPGGYPKIPPIITNESDRVFLLDLNDYIEDEIRKVNSEEAEQRYIIYRNAFNKVRVLQ